MLVNELLRVVVGSEGLVFGVDLLLAGDNNDLAADVALGLEPVVGPVLDVVKDQVVLVVGDGAAGLLFGGAIASDASLLVAGGVADSSGTHLSGKHQGREREKLEVVHFGVSLEG